MDESSGEKRKIKSCFLRSCGGRVSKEVEGKEIRSTVSGTARADRC